MASADFSSLEKHGRERYNEMSCVQSKSSLLPTGWRFEPGATAKEIVEKEAGAHTQTHTCTQENELTM